MTRNSYGVCTDTLRFKLGALIITGKWFLRVSTAGNSMAYVDLNVHVNLFQGDSDQRFVTRIWLDYEKQNECE